MEIVIAKEFTKDIKKVPKNISLEVEKFVNKIYKTSHFEELQDKNISPMKGNYDKAYYRLKIGKYRLGFIVYSETNTISFEVLKPKGEIYKHFPPKKNKRKK